MILPWAVAAAALAVAVSAWVLARRSARRLTQLSQMYWELKYQHSELRIELDRLAGHTSSAALDTPASPATSAFIPLASLKR